MSKEREIDGIKIVVNGEQYEAYKGTLQDKIKKQNKYIEMLQNNIEHLVKENKESKERNEALEKGCKEYRYHIKQMNKIHDNCLDTIEELQDRIDKAINYIGKTDTFQIVHSTDELAEMLREKTIKDLLDILKGSDNNE